VKVIRIEYMLNEVNWKCNIIAKDTNDGINFLEEHLKAPFRVISTEDVCEIHGTSTFIKNLFQNVKPHVKQDPLKDVKNSEESKRKPGRPPKN